MKENETNLFIGRIPKKTKVEFVKLAEADFEGDFGMLVKWLMDFRDGLLSTPNQILMEQMKIISEELEIMKTQSAPKKEKKIIKSVSGKVISEKEE